MSEAQFDLNSTFPKLNFTPVRSLTEDEYEIIEKQMKNEATKKAIRLNVPKQNDFGFTPVSPELIN